MRIISFCALFLVLLSACSSPGSSAADLPAGDATRGEALFTESIAGAPTCASCHALDDSKLMGPGLQGYAERAIMRHEEISADDYTYTSIVQPAGYIVEGYPNSMYAQYEQRLTAQQIADLIAYLLTL